MSEPYCLAMVLCDNIHRDAGTGKFTLLGTFSSLTAREFPAETFFCVYFAVTDGHGKVQLSMRLVDSEADLAGDAQPPVFTTSIEFDFGHDPVMVCESVAFIKTALPKSGVYHCELYADELLLMSRRLIAIDGTKGEEQ